MPVVLVHTLSQGTLLREVSGSGQQCNLANDVGAKALLDCMYRSMNGEMERNRGEILAEMESKTKERRCRAVGNATQVSV